MSNQALLEEPELLTEVPPILKRLAKTIAYAFYEAEHIAILCLLARLPCVDEDTMLERLKFDKRQLRQALARLKSDRLVKLRVHREKQADTGRVDIYNFYFINYKVFVNVVKYKLDHIRRKLESEEQSARNRASGFTCLVCDKKYSDLDVNRLLDFVTGMLKCLHCGGEVEEDKGKSTENLNGSSLARFNEQMEPIFKLLKACESINLAPDVLEPEPTSVQLKAMSNRTHTNVKSGWSTDKKPVDLYDQSIHVNVGDEVDKAIEKAKPKDLPIWMSQSTVFHENSNDSTDSLVRSLTEGGPSTSGNVDTSARTEINKNNIMSDLLAHEKQSKVDVKSALGDINAGDSSEDSEPDSVHNPEQPRTLSLLSTNNISSSQDVEIMDDESDGEDMGEPQVKVGNEMINVSEVTDEISKKMTAEEHEHYLKVYHQYFEQFY